MPIALITGCSSGIGHALAHAFKHAGYDVWATARKVEDVATLQAEGFVALELDVTDLLALQALAERLALDGGGIDVLVNNAGYGAIGPVLDGDPQVLRRQFETNVFGLVDVTRALLPALRIRQGLVVNIGSVSGVLVTPFAGAYCASKAAVHALNEAMRMELKPLGVRVMEVQPGAIDTRFAATAAVEAQRFIAPTSLWWPWREGIKARAQASQNNPTPAPEFASKVVRAVQAPTLKALVRIGHGSRLLPLLALLPSAWLDKILIGKFGLR
jgi:NAD(P)-dependent dehydrogenase (short-subunit alcohol dehydrogenase family)